MHEELEAALRELEAKLPDLRHLIADSGVVLTTSPAALVLAARLLRAISAADEAASLLRLTLLNGGELVASVEQPSQPVPPPPIMVAPSPPEPPDINPAEIRATGSGLTDSDYALQEALGLIPNTSTFFEEAITELEETIDELEQAAASRPEDRPSSYVDNLSGRTLHAMEQIHAIEGAIVERQELEQQSKELHRQIASALDEEDLDTVRELTAKRKDLEKRLAQLTRLPEEQENQIRRLAEKLNLKSDRPASAQESHEDLQSAFRLWGHRYLETFEEAWEEYRVPLEHAMRLYLRDKSETETVTEGTRAHSERVWKAAEGELSFLELLSSLAVQQIERLLPGSPDEAERYIPTSKEVFRYLARHRVERLIADIERRLDHLRLTLQEPEKEYPASAYQEIETLERLHNEVLRQFYNSLIRLSDDGEDTGESDAMGARITPPPPMRGPGAARTFDEALAPARV